MQDIDEQNRKHIKIGKVHAVIEEQANFKNWISRNNTWDTFLMMKRRDKEKLFFRWKWGFTDGNTNFALELTRKSILRDIKDWDLDKVEEGLSWYFKRMLESEYSCNHIKAEIGLVSIGQSKEVDELVNRFKGEVV